MVRKCNTITNGNAWSVDNVTCRVDPKASLLPLRFAQFFLCPLFDESCKDREVNAVDSEHEKNLMNDAWRLFQLEKATGNPNHPFSKFGTGTNTPGFSLWNWLFSLSLYQICI